MSVKNLLLKSMTLRYLSLLVFLLFNTINTQAEEIITTPIPIRTIAEYEVLNKDMLGHTGRINSVAFSPGGQWASSGIDDGTIKLWKIP